MISGPAKIDLTVERLNRGYSPRTLGREIGLSPTTIERAERGEPITPAVAFKLANFLGLKVSEVWDLEKAAA